MKTINFTDTVSAWLLTVKKDSAWLLQTTDFTQIAWNNWKNGFKNPSLDAINAIALALKNVGANIWTPKQLMTEGMEFSVGRSNARSNIAWLLNHYNISAPDIYNEPKFKLAKNSVLNIITHGSQPNFKNLEKFAAAFRALGKADIHSSVDLIYFPVPWGESEKSYLEIRRKIKLID